MDFEEAIAYLYSLRHHSATYGIDRMLVLNDLLGNPDQSYPLIHVAGTNGKGSVCAMLDAIFLASGFKTGLHTSPHLFYLGERIQVNRENISKEGICLYTSKIKSIAEKYTEDKKELFPSFFEFINAMAFLYFRDKNIDIGIIETGLGGEKDSTNVIKPLVSVITSISRDHEEILGFGLKNIAKAKGGIIKEKIPVVLGEIPPEAESVILEIARQKKAPVYKISEHFTKDNYPETNLMGSHQRINAAIATLTCRVLQSHYSLTTKNIESALKSVHWPARFESYSITNDNLLILDATHNEAGALYLSENLENLIRTTGKKPSLIFGTLGESHAEAILPHITKYTNKIYLTLPPSPRAASFEILKKHIPKSFEGEIHEIPLDALCEKGKGLKIAQNSEIYLVTGSIYLAGAVLESISS